MTNHLKKNALFLIYVMGFFLAFHTALPTYINSSFLNLFISGKFLGLIYTLASLLTLVGFFLMPSILRRWGNYRLSFFLIIIELLSLLGLVLFQSPNYLLAFFMIHVVVAHLIYFSLDIFLEGISSDKVTGKIRGTYLTAVNLAWIFAPIISGLILKAGGYQKIYLVSFLLLLPVFLILILNLRRFQDAEYQVTPFWITARAISLDRNLRNIFGANFLLQFFYSWMVIYTPIYLNKNMGFSWLEIGLIFGIMLLPFILTEFPLGWLADRKWGEKEILSVGFITIAISTAYLSFMPVGSSLWFWAFLLFITRLGASSIEIMCDTYFFKKVDSLNANIISFFRSANPLAYVSGPLLATAMLGIFSFDIKYLFLILGGIMLVGLRFSLRLQDTM